METTLSDVLLIGGILLCLVSVLVAVAQLLRGQPPRAAAILLILGIAAMFAGAYLDPRPFTADAVPQAWNRLAGTEPDAGPVAEPSPAPAP